MFARHQSTRFDRDSDARLVIRGLNMMIVLWLTDEHRSSSQWINHSIYRAIDETSRGRWTTMPRLTCLSIHLSVCLSVCLLSSITFPTVINEEYSLPTVRARSSTSRRNDDSRVISVVLSFAIKTNMFNLHPFYIYRFVVVVVSLVLLSCLFTRRYPAEIKWLKTSLLSCWRSITAQMYGRASQRKRSAVLLLLCIREIEYRFHRNE